MDESTVKKIHAKVRIRSLKHKFSAYQHDIAQEVILHYLEGRGKHQTVDQAMIDIIRKQFGDPRTKGYENQKKFRNTSPINPNQFKASSDTILDFYDLLEGLETIQRTILCLSLLWGFTDREISSCLGISNYILTQHRNLALKTLKQKLATSWKSAKLEA